MHRRKLHRSGQGNTRKFCVEFSPDHIPPNPLEGGFLPFRLCPSKGGGENDWFGFFKRWLRPRGPAGGFTYNNLKKI